MLSSLRLQNLTSKIEKIDREKGLTISIQPKNSKWNAVVSFYTLRGNRSIVWVNMNLEEKRNKKKAKELSEKLKEHLLEYIDGLEQGDNCDGILFVDYVDGWFKEKQITLEETTIHRNSNIIYNHIFKHFSHKKLTISQVKPRDVKDYFIHKAIKGRFDNNGGLSFATLQGHANILNQVFNDAIIMGEISQNPVGIVNLRECVPTTESKKAGNTYLTLETANQLLKTFKKEVIYPTVVMALSYGLRRSEVIGLRWQSVDFEKNTFTIEHTVVQHNTIVQKDSTKTKCSKATYYNVTKCTRITFAN